MLVNDISQNQLSAIVHIYENCIVLQRLLFCFSLEVQSWDFFICLSNKKRRIVDKVGAVFIFFVSNSMRCPQPLELWILCCQVILSRMLHRVVFIGCGIRRTTDNRII